MAGMTGPRTVAVWPASPEEWEQTSEARRRAASPEGPAPVSAVGRFCWVNEWLVLVGCVSSTRPLLSFAPPSRTEAEGSLREGIVSWT